MPAFSSAALPPSASKMMTREADGRRDAMQKEEQEQEQDKKHRDKHSQMINTHKDKEKPRQAAFPTFW